MQKLFFLLLSIFHFYLSNAQVQDMYKEEIDAITADARIQKAFNLIQQAEPQTIKNLVELTEIPAPPFMEEKRGLRFKEMLETAGVDSIWVDEVGNVIALRKGTKRNKTVVFEAHLDTVFPIETDVKVKRRGDTLYAPGIGDDTRGLAMVVTVLEAMNTAKVPTEADVLFAGMVGEEGLGDLRGVKHLFQHGDRKIDSYIAIDGGDVGRINNMALGSLRYKVSFHGPGGHSWGAFGLANTHHAIGKAIHYFDEAARAYVANGPKTSYNVGRIGGGTSVNSIPFESWMEIDMRSVSPQKLLGIEKVLKEQMQRALEDYNRTVKKGEALTLNLEKIGDRPSGELGENLPLILKAIAATNYFNAKPTLTRGSTDSNIPIALGTPAITIGRGGQAANAHSLDEWYLNDETGALAIKLAMLILVAEAGLGD